MGKLRELIPIINIFNWADGDEYTVEENTVVLPPELAESDQKTDELADKHFKTTPAKGKSGKGKSQFKVEKEQLNKQPQTQQEKNENSKGIERGE